ncbi:MAG: T9SS type A sorting domain-containing protein [Bacteroidales bacterium]|jgi:hypothetical protein|nr:T9SS type A sorting domain-containing protein [Bacteroidales bacterium]
MRKIFRNVSFLSLLVSLLPAWLLAQNISVHDSSQTSKPGKGVVKIQLPDGFLTKEDSKNSWYPLISPVGKVYDTSIDLTLFADSEIRKGVLYSSVHLNVPGSKGMILYFKDLCLPKGVNLLYETATSEAPTRFNTEIPEGGAFSLPFIEGDDVRLIWELPENLKNKVKLELSGVGVVLYPENTEIGGSGACEVNVNCQEGDAWKDQRDAVVRILVRNQQSVYWCTGVLVNNTARDKTPYILTANHCGKGASQENVAQWQFFFNYESEDCPNPIVEPEKKLTIGGRKKAASDLSNGNLGSDFYLLTLMQGIPAGARAYFAGWSRINEGARQGVCIHHPQGDLKKISTFTSPVVSSNWEATPGTHWKVVWSATANGHGVTEGGSSGSPLFNSDGLIVGTLTGGQASCDSASLNQPDYFGKFSYHWDGNGEADTLRLSPFLDPLNTGVTVLEGTPLAIDERDYVRSQLQIVPNPVKTAFSLAGSIGNNSITKPVNISIYDVSGRLVLQGLWHNPLSECFNVEMLKPGVYLIKIEVSGDNVFLKFIKN